jgi:Chaperone of endosialidase
MAQHDYNIANALFPATRSDINSVLAAIASNNAGASAPATPYASMWWHDTTNNIIKVRNLTNDGWVSVFNVATASAFAPGPTGPTGSTGPTGPTGPAPDVSLLMAKAGGAFTGAVSGPNASFTALTAPGIASTVITMVSGGLISNPAGIVDAGAFRFRAVGVGGDVGWQWWNGNGVGYYWAGTFKGYFDGSGQAMFPNFVIFSDRKLKKNIKNLPSMAGLVDEIKPKSFQMKTDTQHLRWGFIAQDFDGLAPQYEAATGKALDTTALIAILWKALQETRVELKKLQG